MWRRQINLVLFEFFKNSGHRLGVLPNYLNEMGVNVIISGGMGGGAIEIFNEKGIQVVTGAAGDAEDTVHRFLLRKSKIHMLCIPQTPAQSQLRRVGLVLIIQRGDFLSTKPECAVKLFKEGYNCSQAVIGAYCEELGMDMEALLKLASSFGGGMGRLREVCGAVSAMFMIAGLKYGYTDPKDRVVKQKHYELIQMLSQRFKERNGSIVCRELLGLDIKHDCPVPDARTEEYYKKRPCDQLVKCAAEIMDEVLKEREI